MTRVRVVKRGLIVGGSRRVRRALLARSSANNPKAGTPTGRSAARRLGHAQAYLSRRLARGAVVKFTVAKDADVTGKYVAGWFNVVLKDGELVEDIQSDVILMDDMREAAHEFVKSARAAKVMHDGEDVGCVVESVIIDDDFAKAHGITHAERGWWGAIEVTDPDAQERVRKGDLRCFSIGGSGSREPFHKSARSERARLIARLRAA